MRQHNNLVIQLNYTINCYRTSSNILINGPGVSKFMNSELKLIAKILEDNKIQINTQNIQLKSILYNITTGTSHKESKSNTTTNTMDESKTCIGESDKNEQKEEQNTEAKTNQCNYQNGNENQSTSCELCDNEDHDKMIECSECKKWIHYECTNLPPYMTCSLTKGRRKYSWKNCVDNDETSKYTNILKKKEQHNEGEIDSTVNIVIQTEILTEQNEIENLKVLLEEKKHKIKKHNQKMKQQYQ